MELKDNIEYEIAAEKVVYYITKDNFAAGEFNVKEKSKRIIESNKYSPEAMVGLSRAIEDWKINPLTPKELSGESIDISIKVAMEQYENNPSISSIYSIENIIEYAAERNLNIPKSQMEKMRVAIEENKETVDSLVTFVEKVKEKQTQRGLGWYRAEDPEKNQKILKYQDKNDITHAFIAARERKDNHGKFYAAYRIGENNKAVQLKTSENVEVLKNSISAYYTGIMMNEVHVEMLKDYSKTKNVCITDETAKRWNTLLEKGEEKEKIIKHVDQFAEEYKENLGNSKHPERTKETSKEINLEI